jgi:P3 major capsid protein
MNGTQQGLVTTAQAANQAAAARQANLQARALILANSLEEIQQIYTYSFNPSSTNILNIAPRNVGLIKGFLIKVTGTLTTGATGTANRTGYGAANLLSNISFNDLNNYTRTNTTGYHLAMMNTARLGFGYGGSYANNLPMGYGNNWTVQSAPSTIAVSTNQAVSFYYYLPLAYSNQDLSGSIYGQTVTSTMNLQLTVNQSPIINTGDPLNAVYSGNNAAGGWATGNSCTVTVYQVFLDQLPRVQTNQGLQVVLPPLDLQTIYAFQYTSNTGLTAGQDFGIPYANFRNFLSTLMIYDNAGVYNTGSDINYFSLQAANTQNIWKFDPATAALFARATFMGDPPPGTYYMDSRSNPINTQVFGNMMANINPSAVTTGANVITCWEMLYSVNQIVNAASLPGGAG